MMKRVTLREAIESIECYYWLNFDEIIFYIRDKFCTEEFSAKGLESFKEFMQEFECLDRNVIDVLHELMHLKDKRKTVISGVIFILEPLR